MRKAKKKQGQNGETIYVRDPIGRTLLDFLSKDADADFLGVLSFRDRYSGLCSILVAWVANENTTQKIAPMLKMVVIGNFFRTEPLANDNPKKSDTILDKGFRRICNLRLLPDVAFCPHGLCSAHDITDIRMRHILSAIGASSKCNAPQACALKPPWMLDEARSLPVASIPRSNSERCAACWAVHMQDWHYCGLQTCFRNPDLVRQLVNGALFRPPKRDGHGTSPPMATCLPLACHCDKSL